MASEQEIRIFPLGRKQVSLAFKIFLCILVGGAIYGSFMLMHLRAESVDRAGTVISHGADPSDEGDFPYLLVQLDGGQIVRVRFAGALDYRPRRPVLVREVTTRFFGLKKYELKGYVDAPRGR